ncbi:Pheophytinase [Cardamine amara subsp. amara]|uniref:Pheophytinase n=1 Tax=Cardamine amara subsp. amara TaxID=228776 RepID=A0ABD1A303_CARAN
MASFALPHFLTHRLLRNHRRNRCRCGSTSATNESSTAVVWFKHDLRVDDHPGLLAASKHRAIIPLYVFDHRILSRYTTDTLELAILALEELRNSLKKQGSNLMLRYGNAENVIEELVKEVRAPFVFVEEEVEYHLSEVLDAVKKKLEGVSLPGEPPRIVVWRTPFYESQNLMDLPQSWEEFKKLKLPLTLPVPAARFTSPGNELQWGPVPTLDDLKDYMKESLCEKENSWRDMAQASAQRVLMERIGNLKGSSIEPTVDGSLRKKVPNSAFVTRKGDTVGGGTEVVLNALAGYLRYLEGTSRDDWQEVHARLRDAEIRPGASFFKLFGPVLCLGIVSRRRVHYEAIEYEKERNAGFVSPFGYSAATVSAATDAVCSMEWYSLVALNRERIDVKKRSVRIWRWKGYLIQYTVAGNEGPAVLLVHGFGAFLEHYRDNIESIVNRKNRVWTITVLGFGKSEKPNIIYTELLWAEFLRDFMIEVVGEPAHCVGNSIGGYFVALMAFLWPALLKSVVLVNSAGNVLPGYSPLPISRERRVSLGAKLGARLLLLFLQFNVKKLLKDCYPVKPERADDFLITEMLRASQEPGVVMVLESIFGFDLSLPLNYLLKGFEEKTLVILGMKDPISDPKKKVALLKELCSAILIKKVNAGHCPHDEIPEEVNPIICEWIVKINNDEQELKASSQQIYLSNKQN